MASTSEKLAALAAGTPYDVVLDDPEDDVALFRIYRAGEQLAYLSCSASASCAGPAGHYWALQVSPFSERGGFASETAALSDLLRAFADGSAWDDPLALAIVRGTQKPLTPCEELVRTLPDNQRAAAEVLLGELGMPEIYVQGAIVNGIDLTVALAELQP